MSHYPCVDMEFDDRRCELDQMLRDRHRVTLARSCGIAIVIALALAALRLLKG